MHVLGNTNGYVPPGLKLSRRPGTALVCLLYLWESTCEWVRVKSPKWSEAVLKGLVGRVDVV